MLLTVAISCLLFHVSFARADTSGDPAQEKEAVCSTVRQLIEKGEANRQELKTAISTAEGKLAVYPDDMRFLLLLSEAYYRMADCSNDIDQEFHYYEKVGQYSEKVLQMSPQNMEAHYWHGLFLLKKAQKVGGIRAYSIVKEGIAELEKVRQGLPAVDHGGASRVLGLLYYTAPRWTPFGNLEKSVQLAEEATRLDPNYPLNHLYLANAYSKRGKKEEAIREYKALLTLICNDSTEPARSFAKEARTNLSKLGQPEYALKDRATN